MSNPTSTPAPRSLLTSDTTSPSSSISRTSGLADACVSIIVILPVQQVTNSLLQLRGQFSFFYSKPLRMLCYLAQKPTTLHGRVIGIERGQSRVWGVRVRTRQLLRQPCLAYLVLHLQRVLAQQPGSLAHK